MPQPYTRSGTAQNAGGCGTRSRHLQLADASSQSLRRMLVRNSLEAKLHGVQRKFLERATALCNFRMQQARRSILEQQKRLVAYKLVLQKHPIADRIDYQAALNDDYSLHGLRHELRRVLHDLDPDTIRKHKIDEMVKASHKRYREAVFRNRDLIHTMFPVTKQNGLSPELKVAEKPTSASDKKPDHYSPVPPSPTKPLVALVQAGLLPVRARGLVRDAQVVTQRMMKENAWFKGSAVLPDVRLSPRKEMNPRPVLPAIQAAPHNTKALSVASSIATSAVDPCLRGVPQAEPCSILTRGQEGCESKDSTVAERD